MTVDRQDLIVNLNHPCQFGRWRPPFLQRSPLRYVIFRGIAVDRWSMVIDPHTENLAIENLAIENLAIENLAIENLATEN